MGFAATNTAQTGLQRLSSRSGTKCLLLCVLLTLAACSSPGAREAELAAQEAARVAAEQEQARLERERALAAERERQERAEAQARIQAQRDAEAARMRAEAEAREAAEREEAERRERERLAAIAAAEQERRQRLQRIASLEQQIAQIQQTTGDDQRRSALLREAIVAAEELLDALTAEQAKYENTDEQGNTVEPLAKELIAELEARKNNLVQQINN
jgi:dTMP kinase